MICYYIFIPVTFERVQMSFGKRIAWLEGQKNKKNIKKQANKIVLFDMDGTLTDPRKPFDQALAPSLLKLSKYSDIGIVTGSDLNYIQQQLHSLLTHSELKYSLHLLPCNGTKYYKPPKNSFDNFELASEVDMRKKINNIDFKNIMISLIESQAAIDLHHLPLSGHFISYRGSMINWCPIGRNATDKQRKYFVHYDTAHERTYRQQLKEQLERKLKNRGTLKYITIKFGGSTSFDIYPKGWDKSFCLKHFDGWETWFIGDRCEEGGNDQELYDLLAINDRAYKTENTLNTGLIIEEQLIPTYFNDENI
jgi:phosphomannomutase